MTSGFSVADNLLYRWTEHAPDALFQGRAALRHAVDAHGLSDEVADDVMMAGAELMANAVEHARGPYELHLRRTATEVVCEVADHDPRIPEFSLFSEPSSRDSRLCEETRAMSSDLVCEEISERGRGLRIVNELSQGGWGVRISGGRKVVWCSISLRETELAVAESASEVRKYCGARPGKLAPLSDPGTASVGTEGTGSQAVI
jgi:anti-sigma regulatory factor (Ser/Thr protein kinase)